MLDPVSLILISGLMFLALASLLAGMVYLIVQYWKVDVKTYRELMADVERFKRISRDRFTEHYSDGGLDKKSNHIETGWSGQSDKRCDKRISPLD